MLQKWSKTKFENVDQQVAIELEEAQLVQTLMNNKEFDTGLQDQNIKV